jgi:hypothetical protein
MQLKCRILIAAPTLPPGAALSRAVLKILVLFVAEYGITAYEDKHGESSAISLLEFSWCSRQEAGTGTFPQSAWSLLSETRNRERRLSACKIYICHRTEQPTEGGGTGTLVRLGTDHYFAPALCFTQLQTTATHIKLDSGPLKILAMYLLPSRPLIGSDLSACFGGGLPVLMAPLPACIQDELCLKNRLRRQWQITRDPDLKLTSTVFSGR